MWAKQKNPLSKHENIHVWIGEDSKAPDEHYQRASQNIRLAARYANPVKARATIDGPVVFRNEWDLGLFSALGADDRMHLAGRALRAATISTFRTTAGAAFGATTGLIQQPFLLVKLLLSGSERKFTGAFTAFENFVNETQNQGPPCGMLVFLQVHKLAESPTVCHPKQRGTKFSGRTLYTRPRLDTDGSIHYHPLVIKTFSQQIAAAPKILMRFLYRFVYLSVARAFLSW